MLVGCHSCLLVPTLLVSGLTLATELERVVRRGELRPAPLAIGLLPAAALLVLGAGLASRSRLAWWIELALVAIGTALLLGHLPEGAPDSPIDAAPCVAVPAAALLVLLLLARREVLTTEAPPTALRPRQALGGVALAASFVAVAFLAAWLRATLAGPVRGGWAEPIAYLGALATAGVVALGGLQAWRLAVRARREPERVAPETRARIVALRAEGKRLREVAATLEAERRAPPGGGAWDGLLLRGVLRLSPARPPAPPPGP